MTANEEETRRMLYRNNVCLSYISKPLPDDIFKYIFLN